MIYIYEIIRYFLYYQIVMIIIGAIRKGWANINVFYRWTDSKAAFFHEKNHYIMAKILGTGVRLRDVHVRSDGSGSVRVPRLKNIYFVKESLISMAPLFLGTIEIIESNRLRGIHPIMEDTIGTIIILLLKFIILIGICPSNADMAIVYRSITYYSKEFWKQFSLLLLSIFLFTIYRAPFMVFKYEILHYKEEYPLSYTYNSISILLIFTVLYGIQMVLGAIYKKIKQGDGSKYLESRIDTSEAAIKHTILEQHTHKLNMIEHPQGYSILMNKSIKKLKKFVKSVGKSYGNFITPEDKIHSSIPKKKKKILDEMTDEEREDELLRLNFEMDMEEQY